MCGIVGILGSHEVAPFILEALKRLEYRGYDSAGIATLQDGRLDRRRAVGKLYNLSDRLVHEPLPGKAGIGHTRWATHGAPTEANAHPHRAGRVAVVHNGIIENYRELRAELSDRPFESETDTETVARLCERFLDEGLTPQGAATETVKRLEGAFALAFLFDGEEDLIVAARRGSPLAIGHGEGEMFVGSDAIALAPLTHKITYLDEGDIAFVTRAGVEIRDEAGNLANREARIISAEATAVDKAGHRHFMAKEIFEQPTVLADCLRHYSDGRQVSIREGDLDFTTTDRLILVACGTAHYACHVAKYWFEQLAGLPCDVDIASEFRYREPPVSDRSTAAFSSASRAKRPTRWPRCAMPATRPSGIVSVVNVAESSIARESDLALPILAGVEVGVASTKAFMNQLGVLVHLAINGRPPARPHQRRARGRAAVGPRRASRPHQPGACAGAEDREAHPPPAEARSVLFLGRGAMFPHGARGAR